MSYTFSKNGTDTEKIVKELKNFFISNEGKKIEFIDRDGVKRHPLKSITPYEPIKQQIGHIIADIYERSDSFRVTNTILQLFLGEHLPIGDPKAIWLSEGSTIEFFGNAQKSFVISQYGHDKNEPPKQFIAKVLGFENVSFGD